MTCAMVIILLMVVLCGIVVFIAPIMADESCIAERSCENCKHSKKHGLEEPCCDCAPTFPKLVKWEKK